MEDLGLPLAFGKPQQQPQQPQQEASTHALPPKPEPRAEPGQRGPRGIVGGGKRRRGRGFAGTGANAERMQSKDDSNSAELNAGVKVSITGPGPGSGIVISPCGSVPLLRVKFGRRRDLCRGPTPHVMWRAPGRGRQSGWRVRLLPLSGSEVGAWRLASWRARPRNSATAPHRDDKEQRRRISGREPERRRRPGESQSSADTHPVAEPERPQSERQNHH